MLRAICFVKPTQSNCVHGVEFPFTVLEQNREKAPKLLHFNKYATSFNAMELEFRSTYLSLAQILLTHIKKIGQLSS